MITDKNLRNQVKDDGQVRCPRCGDKDHCELTSEFGHAFIWECNDCGWEFDTPRVSYVLGEE